MYKHLFFDLDNTLWDFQANAREAFRTIFTDLGLFGRIPDFDRFMTVYEQCNDYLWTEYRRGKVKKDTLRSERMVMTFREMGIDDRELALKVGEIYVHTAPKMTNLFEGVQETLAALSEKYRLYLLTNGFTEIQVQKINNTGLKPYFSKLFMAEMVGFQKPDRRFFEYAVKSVHGHKSECLMIGDDPEADIRGASQSGIDQVFFNPAGKSCPVTPTYEIKEIRELLQILE
jgi:putative hydrolase of the HAD superfamily